MLQTAVRLCALAALCLFACTARADIEGVPKYDHIFVIILENHGFDQIIGRKDIAPNLNALADNHGLALHYFGVVHPSKANYIAMIAGTTFGMHDDDPYDCKADSKDFDHCPAAKKATEHAPYVEHTRTELSLIDQLKEKGLTWRGYYEDIPGPGSKDFYNPNDKDHALYASKHTAFINFKSVQDSPELLKNIVGFDQLDADLRDGTLPNYAHIVPNQCNDMHGMGEPPASEPNCTWGTPGLITRGDKMVNDLVTKIMGAKFWDGVGNNAIVITWDEDSKFAGQEGEHDGCCGFKKGEPGNSGGGRVPTIVITNHGPGHIVDDGLYNHYSLLRTTEAAFGITGFLNMAGHADEGVHAMAKLFAVKK